MIITDLWSLHYQDFLIQVSEATDEEIKKFQAALAEKFDDKKFFIVMKGGKF